MEGQGGGLPRLKIYPALSFKDLLNLSPSFHIFLKHLTSITTHSSHPPNPISVSSHPPTIYYLDTDQIQQLPHHHEERPKISPHHQRPKPQPPRHERTAHLRSRNPRRRRDSRQETRRRAQSICRVLPEVCYLPPNSNSNSNSNPSPNHISDRSSPLLSSFLLSLPHNQEQEQEQALLTPISNKSATGKAPSSIASKPLEQTAQMASSSTRAA